MQGAPCPPLSHSASEPPQPTQSKVDESTMNAKVEQQSEQLPKTPKTEEDQLALGAKRQQSKSIDSDNRSDCSASPAADRFPERDLKSECNICGLVLPSAAELAQHELSHDRQKLFNNKPPIDRFKTVHLGEKSYRCKHCDLSFATSNKMHRHVRSHKFDSADGGSHYDSDESSASSDGERKDNQRFARKRPLEFNNNGESDIKRKIRTVNNNFIKEMWNERFTCPVCARDDFLTVNILETHIEGCHPEHPIRCTTCNIDYKNYRALNLHRSMKHQGEEGKLKNRKLENNVVAGFNDHALVDFSCQKFPQIAKTMCEQNLHKSVSEQIFQCLKCTRNFPCENSLMIHRQSCFLDITMIGKKRHLSETTDEDMRREDFFAKLDLQNKAVDPNSSPTQIHPIPIQKLAKDQVFATKEFLRPLIDTNKDLADIQSILSVTSTGGLLEQLTNKVQEPNLITPPDMIVRENETEETQDQFAAEFRKMKLRGEFPCRLCPAKFPNLRALKGHNRVHLSGNGPGPYRCNMCPHSSLDKAALIRHMRTHNGDRPYECAVCNYAFTTKANCERHLRNRHAKVTREEVKRSIIYHPSEDPNNDEVNSKMNISREEIKRSLVFSTPESDRRDDSDTVVNDRSTPLSHYPKDHSLAFLKDRTLIIPQPRDILRPPPVIESPNKIHQEEPVQPRIKVRGFGKLTQIPEFHEPLVNRNSEEEPVEDIYDNKSAPYSTDSPIDLSTNENNDDVLDLSKKRPNPNVETKIADDVNKFQGHSMEFSNDQAAAAAASMFEKTQQILLAQQQLLKNVQMPKLDPASAFYANQLSQLYRTGMAGLPGLAIPPAFPINPYFLQPHPFLTPSANPQDIVEMKERIQKEIMRNLQMSGGGLVNMEHNNIVNNMAIASERLQAFHQQALNNIPSGPEVKPQTPIPTIKIEDDKPLHINTDCGSQSPYHNSFIPSPKSQKRESITSHSPNSVKMVIKNGVLMPKQKQRRYRTERPFSCEHCSARFTLRSNMERHIKQQHPQYWSQRQRANIGSLPRKNSLTMVPQNMSVPSLAFDGRLHFIKNINSNGDNPINVDKDYRMNNMHSPIPNNKPYPISDQVKYALLAQQLKSHHQQNMVAHNSDLDNKIEESNSVDNELEDEDDALVIDEEPEQKVSLEEKTLSEAHSVEAEEENSVAKKVAQEILLGVSAKQQDLTKDFDLKITGNLISKNRNHLSVTSPIIPTFVSQFDKVKQETKTIDLSTKVNKEEGDLVPVSRLLDNAVSQLPFGKYFKNNSQDSGSKMEVNNVQQQQADVSEEEEEGLVASSGSTSEGNNSGSDENRSESDAANPPPQKKKSAYSLAPNRVSCPYCHRKFPWSSSLRRHVLTHTGQKPFKCPHCPLLFTTKSNCDRHLLRKHGSQGGTATAQAIMTSPPHYPEVMNNTQSAPNTPGFMLRNVPERPYKCASCPSSTFSTLSNLKKHMSSKHGIIISDSRPNSPHGKSETDESTAKDDCQAFTSDDEKCSRHPEMIEDLSVKSSLGSCKTSSTLNETGSQQSEWELQIAANKSSPITANDVNSGVQNSELPFKCHLCEGSYGERHEALDHIKDTHPSEYELLMSKGALETNLEDMTPASMGSKSESCEEPTEENMDQLRGKFPDYANRKVVCAFCMRRFWSAEDLRRHMRTHTGERPFSCDICRRRFTLKHSMLRHRKKHTSNPQHSTGARSTSGEDFSTASGDEDSPPPSSCNSTNRNETFSSPVQSTYHGIMKTSTPISSKISNTITLNGYQFAVRNKNVSISPEIPNNVNNNNSPPSSSFEKSELNIKKERPNTRSRYSSDDNDCETENGNDLIGNLLGISDRGMINKLLSSADEAAKLLGVNK